MLIIMTIVAIFMLFVGIWMFKNPTIIQSNDENAMTNSNNLISISKYNQYILPTNHGRSIDAVVTHLKENDICPEFHVDMYRK